ncbi:AAA family ATPase [Neisseria sp. Ec49-e6-T10]|uniref:AAA family ATPase n=1 Tax=Neisseria sp. Ec49-e6-T10 TaxID=3140744 RepID=UPI003EBF07ED
MIKTLAIANFRSIQELILPLQQLNIITGANGSGKSNLYKSLHLLYDAAQGNVIQSLAREGGLNSVLWAGPEQISRRMRQGEISVQGTVRTKSLRLKMGFSGETFGYNIVLGRPEYVRGNPSAFALDPAITHEAIWAGEYYSRSSVLTERKGAVITIKKGRQKEVLAQHTSNYESMLLQLGEYDSRCSEIMQVREFIKQWRFYDYFRTDRDSPARQPQLGTRTPVLHHDGHDLAAALQTIIEIGDSDLLYETIEDAFPGTSLEINTDDYFTVFLQQPGMLRPLSAKELSDGTLRYLMLSAALLTPRPPSLLVLNEPENSLHSDLLPALARLIIRARKRSQIWVITHSKRLINALELEVGTDCNLIELEKEFGQTTIKNQIYLETPVWQWSI